MLNAPPQPSLSAAATQALLEVAPSALALLQPVYAPGTTKLTDFTLGYLNAAGQRLLQLPAPMGASLLEHFPQARETGLFAYCCRVFEAEATTGPLLNHLDYNFELSAHRHGEQLALGFTGIGWGPSPVVADAHPGMNQLQLSNTTLRANNAVLRDQQQDMLVANEALEARVRARTQALELTLAIADEQRAQLECVFEQAPVSIVILRGADFVVAMANGATSALWGRAPEQAKGKPLLEVLPEVAGLGLHQAFEQVLLTGVPYTLTELPVAQAREEARPPALRYFNVTCQPLRDAAGQLPGLIVVGVEVTEQVQFRQQVLRLNEELLASNQELATTNEQLTCTNAELDNFIYTASHDLREPINNLEGLVQALAEVLPASPGQGEQVQPVLEMMQGAVQRFQQTIAQLTDVGGTITVRSQTSLGSTFILARSCVDGVAGQQTPGLSA